MPPASCIVTCSVRPFNGTMEDGSGGSESRTLGLRTLCKIGSWVLAALCAFGKQFGHHLIVLDMGSV